MAPRSVEATPERWAELGRYVVRKREALELDQQDLVEEAGVSKAVVSKIENGRPDNNHVRATTLRKLSTALLLPPDGLELLAQGVDPIDFDRFEEAHWRMVENAGGWEQFYPQVAQRLDRLEARVQAVEVALGDYALAAESGRRIPPEEIAEVARRAAATTRRPRPKTPK